MKKNCISWMFAVLMLAIGMSSCSSDDEEPFVQQAFVSKAAYSIGYSLKNELGFTTSTFKEGENIIFDVTINNNTGYRLQLGEERMILQSATSIYRSDGEFVENPYNGISMTYEYRTMTIEPNGSMHWSSPWIINESYLRSLGVEQPELVLNNIPLKRPLLKGTYYSLFKTQVSYRIVNDPAPGGGTKGIDEIELKIPFTVK